MHQKFLQDIKAKTCSPKSCEAPSLTRATDKAYQNEVERQRLGQYVVMPAGLEISFKARWISFSGSAMVDVRYPHGHHGNAGKTSNSAKTTVMEDFLAFVDGNSQPNGRSADSTGPTFYFLPNFSTIQTPKRGCPNYSERLKRSLVGEFNRVQHALGKGECSNGLAHNWLKQKRPKHAICPHQWTIVTHAQ